MNDVRSPLQNDAPGAGVSAPLRLFVARRPTSGSDMLVLIATSEGALLCASCNGNTRLIRAIAYRLCPRSDDPLNPDGKAALAYKLLSILERETLAQSCFDCITVFADAALYPEFCRLRAIERCDFLIAKIDNSPQGRKSLGTD